MRPLLRRRQSLLGQVLLRDILRHPLQPLVEQRSEAAPDLTVHEHQHLALVVKAAAVVVADDVAPEGISPRADMRSMLDPAMPSSRASAA